jgi:hypothetical protein
MRAVALLAVVGALGCSSESEPPERKPELAARPPGSGWACFYDSVNATSLCARPDACEPFRRGLAAEYDRKALDYSLTPCVARNAVSCLTMLPVTDTRYAAVCFEFASECEKSRAFYASQTVDYKNVSDYCAVW